MPVDPNIALQVRPVEVADPMQQYGRAVQLRSLVGQGRLQDLQIAEAQRNATAGEQFRQALKTGVTTGPDGAMSISDLPGLMQADPTRAAALVKQVEDSRAARARTERDTVQADQARGLIATQRHTAHLQRLSLVGDDPAAMEEWLREGARSGVMPPQAAASITAQLQANPAALPGLRQALMQSGLTMKEQLERSTPKPVEQSDGQTKFFIDGNPTSPTYGQRIGPEVLKLLPSPDAMLTDKRTREEGAANRGVTIRGQNMADARAGAALDVQRQTANAGRWQNDFESGTQVNMATGERRPITEGGSPVGPRPKDMTDAQGKALLFGSRAEQANAEIAKLSAQPGGFITGATDRPGWWKRTAEQAAGSVPIVGDSLSRAAGASLNWTQSDAQQRVEQAQRDFVNAILRRESGAVISDSEFENARRQYFPMIGDSPAVLEQKARNRDLAVRGIKAEVPERSRTLPGAPAPSAPGARPPLDAFQR